MASHRGLWGALWGAGDAEVMVSLSGSRTDAGSHLPSQSQNHTHLHTDTGTKHQRDPRRLTSRDRARTHRARRRQGKQPTSTAVTDTTRPSHLPTRDSQAFTTIHTRSQDIRTLFTQVQASVHTISDSIRTISLFAGIRTIREVFAHLSRFAGIRKYSHTIPYSRARARYLRTFACRFAPRLPTGRALFANIRSNSQRFASVNFCECVIDAPSL